MKKLLFSLAALLAAVAAQGQTLNVTTGNTVTDQYPASQTGVMTFGSSTTDTGRTLTILNKTYNMGEITSMYTDDTAVTDNQVSVVYNGSEALVTVAGNVARYVEVTVDGAKVYVNQTNTDAVDNDEITYVLSGTSTDGQFALDGSYKCTLSLNNLTLTNQSGAAISIGNKKRIQISAKNGTTNTLADCANGSQKGCIYSKGQIQLQGKGTLNVAGYTAHAIKSGDYISVKNLTLNITKAVKDGLNANKYMLIESGTITISGVGDDGMQSDFETDDATTGETTGHEDENSANTYIEGGTLNVTVTGTAAKSINVGGDMRISGGSLTLTSTGAGGKCIKCDGALTITGGTITATASGSNYRSGSETTSAKAIKSDGAMTITDGVVYAKASAHEAIETKSTLDISGGSVYAYSSDDAINSASHMTVSGGIVMAHSTGNDGMDANGNMYIKGGLVYAISAGQPEVALDANTEQQYKLYIQGGTLIAIGGIENGASISQTCYTTGGSSQGGGHGPGGGFGPGGGGGNTGWSTNTWYAMTVGSNTYAFKTPSSGGSSIVVSAASQPSMLSGVTVSSGTAYFDSQLYTGATVSGGSTVSLSTYSGGGQGGGGGWW